MPVLVFVNRRSSELDIWYSSEPNKGNPGFKPSPMSTPRHGLASIPLSNDRGAFVGGTNGSNYLSVNEIYNFKTNSWTTKASMPSPRTYLSAIPLSNDRGIFVGGYYYTSLPSQINEMYDFTTDTWSTRTSLPVSGRSHQASIPLSNNRGIFVGGYGSYYHNDNQMYDFTTNTWTIKAPMPTGRYALTAIPLSNNRGAFVGGKEANYYSINEVYDLTIDTWTVRASMFFGRHGLTSIPLSNNRGAFVGGQRWNIGHYSVSDNEIYDFASDTWTVKAPMPTTRGYLSAVSLSNNRGVFVGGINFADRVSLSINEIYYL